MKNITMQKTSEIFQWIIFFASSYYKKSLFNQIPKSIENMLKLKITIF